MRKETDKINADTHVRVEAAKYKFRSRNKNTLKRGKEKSENQFSVQYKVSD